MCQRSSPLILDYRPSHRLSGSRKSPDYARCQKGTRQLMSRMFSKSNFIIVFQGLLFWWDIYGLVFVFNQNVKFLFPMSRNSVAERAYFCAKIEVNEIGITRIIWEKLEDNHNRQWQESSIIWIWFFIFYLVYYIRKHSCRHCFKRVQILEAQLVYF